MHPFAADGKRWAGTTFGNTLLDELNRYAASFWQENQLRNLEPGATMKINRDNIKWSARLMSIILIVGIADALVVIFMRHPFPFTVIIPCLVPILVALFVIIPMSRAQKA